MTPYESVWRAPRVFVRRRGVVVYHTYEDDDINQGPETFYFTTNREGRYDGETDQFYFDVREIATWVEPQHPEYMDAEHGGATPEKEAAWHVFHNRTEPAAIRRAVRDAIDRGLLTRNGYTAPPKGVPVLPPVPGPAGPEG